MSGLGLTLFGAIGRGMLGAFRTGAADLMGGGVWIEGDVPPEVTHQILQEIGGYGSGMYAGADPVAPVLSFVSGLLTLVMVAGIVLTVAGVVLALWLYRKGR